ncbi:MAG: glycosyltransferase family 2 protein, partial [Chitinophagaceae bacterium]
MRDRTPVIPPVIPPLPLSIGRPLWSVMIPAYNCIQFLPEALETVLAQALADNVMQIEVVDDASIDGDVEALVRKIGKGRISYFRQEKNVGSLRNFETCINRAQGSYIHLLHGDDFLSPGFYEEVGLLFQKFPEAGMACTGFTQVNDKGEFICNST